jgi:hypothetical protein
MSVRLVMSIGKMSIKDFVSTALSRSLKKAWWLHTFYYNHQGGNPSRSPPGSPASLG